MTIRFAVRGDHILLDQLLKATGLCASGGAAHAAVAEGRVKVDGVVETRKRAKLRAGQRVEIDGDRVELKAGGEGGILPSPLAGEGAPKGRERGTCIHKSKPFQGCSEK